MDQFFPKLFNFGPNAGAISELKTQIMSQNYAILDRLNVICFVITCETSSIIGRISIVKLDALDGVGLDEVPDIMVRM